MAIDYQQILMDMNRPHRRQGNTMKKLMVVVCILLIVGGGGYALWETGLAGRAWNGAQSMIGSVFGRESTPAAAPAVAAVVEQPAETVAAVAPARRPSVSAAVQIPVQPPAEQTAPVRPAPQDGVLRLAVADVAKTAEPAEAPASQPSLRPASPAQAQAQLQAQAMQRQEQQQFETRALGQSQPEPQRAAQSVPAAATPVLSDAKAQMRVVDQMLSSDPAEALRRIEDVLAMPGLPVDDAAEAGYRKGYAARMLRDEALAEKTWKETAENYSNLRGGRFSALALADTWFHKYAGDRPQISYWDDIQVMYSRVLGQDDAPFLPEPVKASVKTKLNRINDLVFFGSAPSKLARYHKVESGEYLSTIGNKYRVDYESISRINGIDPNRIRVGMDLKLVVGEVTIVVRKNEKLDKTPTVTWFLDGRWAREYPACVGDGNKTPAGTYNLTSKDRFPSWTNPANGQQLSNDHPENILGSRWMAMEKKDKSTQGLGIHGTTVDDSIPGYTSAGCVRLLNKDVEELFSFARIDNKVTVLE